MRTSFKLAALSSTTRMGSPAIGLPRRRVARVRALYGSARRTHRKLAKLFDKGVTGPLTLENDPVRRRGESALVLARKVLRGPHNHRCLAASGRPPETIEEVEPIHARHQEVEDH